MRISTICLFLSLCTASVSDLGLAAEARAHRSGPLVIAHRGDSTHAPENTLASFEKAVGEGVDYVELDVHLSADHQVIVMHDDTVDRTSNGHGRVADLTLAQIQALDAGSWFSPQFAGERIPTLDQVLAKMKGRAGVLIELKQVEPDGDAAAVGRAEELVRRCLAMIEQLHVAGQVRFHTFYPRELNALKKLVHDIPFDFLYDFPEKTHLACIYAKVHHASGLNPRFEFTSRTQVALAHQLGLTVFPYTEDSDVDYARAVAIGVDGIITNHPHEAAAWLAARAN